jgi:hypothetical protein
VAIVDVGYRSAILALVQEGTIRQDVIRGSAHGLAMAVGRLEAEVASQVELLSGDETLELFLAVVGNRTAMLRGQRLPADLDLRALHDEVQEPVGDVRSALAGVNYRYLL